MWRILISITLVTLASTGPHAGAAQSASSGTWKVQNPLVPIVGLVTVACPSLTDCIAGGNDMVFFTHDGGTTWHHSRVHSGSQISRVVCVSAASCFVLDQVIHGRQTQGVLVRTQDGGRTWKDTATFPETFINGASCPTPTVCYAAGATVSNQSAPVAFLRSDDGGASWTRVQGQALYSVSLSSLTCPGPALCYVGGNQGVLVTHNAGSTWIKRPLAAGSADPSPGANINSISCPSTDICYAISGNGSVVGTRDSWNTATELRPADAPGHPPFSRITCPSPSVCYAASYSRSLAETTDGGAHWSTVETDSANDLQAVACAATNICVAVGDRTTIFWTRDGGVAWRSGLPGTTNSLSGIACSAITTCTVVGAAGTILRTTDGGTTWRIDTSGVQETLVAAACPTVTTCYAVGGSRHVLQNQGPFPPAIGPIILRTTDGGTSWTVAARDPIGGRPLDLAGIACPSADFCYATSDSGAILSTSNGGRTWQWGRTGAYFQLRGIACPTTTHCVAVGGLDAECNSLRQRSRPSAFRELDGCFAPEEGVIFATDDGGRSWQRRFYRQLDLNGSSNTGAHLFSVSCPGPMVCLAAGHNIVLKTADGGHTWKLAANKPVAPALGGPWQSVASLACPSPTTCWAVSGPPAPFRTADGGNTWTSGPPNPRPRAGPIQGLDCPSLDTCYAVGDSGLIMRLFAAKSAVSTASRTGTSPGW
jgi:photosystem II stability/assembly factor-like uncharacterized protein